MRYLLLVAALLVAAAGYGAYWVVLAGRVETAVEDWIAARRAEGYEVGHAGLAVSGFPFRVVVELEQPTFADPRSPAAWSWSGRRLTGWLQPWNLRHLIIDPGPVHHLAWDTPDGRRTAEAAVAAAKASLVLSGDGRLDRLAADLHQLTITSPALGGPVQADRLQLHTRHQPAASEPLQVSLRGDDLTLPPELAEPLGQNLPHFRLQFTSPLPPPDGPEDLERWRAAGGTLDVERLEIAWGPLDVSGNGTFTLDREHRPLGAFATEIRGFAETIAALTEAGLVKRDDARTAIFALGLLARRGDDGRPTLQAPVTFQDGRLYLGPVALVRLPRLALPGDRSSVR